MCRCEEIKLPTGKDVAGDDYSNSSHRHHPGEVEGALRSNKVPRMMVLITILGACTYFIYAMFLQSAPLKWKESHLILPRHLQHHHSKHPGDDTAIVANMTLREFLTHEEGIHLGMAPSFFGFYGYFGALAAWDDELTVSTNNESPHNRSTRYSMHKIRSVAGASAGAMAAVLLASGIAPREAAEFCKTVTLDRFADPPGLLAMFKGHKFEEIMFDFLLERSPEKIIRLEDGKIPVAVSGFDIQTMSGKILSTGSMARAARASANFPGLFQPVAWREGGDDFLLTDGGLADVSGVKGLTPHFPDSPKRVVNIVVGNFLGDIAPGPSTMPEELNTQELLSISIQNLPQCGPWAMESGPMAVEASRKAMAATLDMPLFKGKENGHYELKIDAAAFIGTSSAES